MINLRSYQIEARGQVRERWRHERGQMVVLPTGTGKTMFGLSLVVDAALKGFRVVWLAHRKELLDQPLRTLQALWPDVAADAGVVQGERDASDARVVFASVDTLRNPGRLARVIAHGFPLLVVCDEAHHSTARTWRTVVEGLTDPERAPYRLGLTATPERADRGDLGKLWQVAYFYSLDRALAEGHLTPPRFEVDRLPGLDDIALDKIGGREDYDEAELGRELMLAGIVEHTVAAMERHATGRHALVFTVLVEQARLTAEGLCAAGWRAAFVSGETGEDERAALLRAFEDGELDALCNAAVLTEGTDLPIADCVVVARPTRSKPLYVQMVGRGLRLYPGKAECLVLDVAGASQEHTRSQAPVLVGGACDHRWQEHGVCAECGQTCKCWRSPTGSCEFPDLRCTRCGQGKHARLRPCPIGGVHQYAPCRYCGEVQCATSPDLRHVWRPDSAGISTCSYCPAQVVDPLRGLVGKREKPQPVEWIEVDGLDRRALVVDVGENGMVMLLQDGRDWRPMWLKKRGKPAPLCEGAVSLELARGLCDDLVRRASPITKPDASWRLRPPTEKQRALAEKFGVTADTSGALADAITSAMAMRRASERGLAVRVAPRRRAS